MTNRTTHHAWEVVTKRNHIQPSCGMYLVAYDAAPFMSRIRKVHEPSKSPTPRPTVNLKRYKEILHCLHPIAQARRPSSRILNLKHKDLKTLASQNPMQKPDTLKSVFFPTPRSPAQVRMPSIKSKHQVPQPYNLKPSNHTCRDTYTRTLLIRSRGMLLSCHATITVVGSAILP